MPLIKLGRYWASLSKEAPARRRSTEDACILNPPMYSQQDWHSCGFVAALTVVHHYRPEVTKKSVLEFMRPHHSRGCDEFLFAKALERFGVTTEERTRLGIGSIFKLLSAGSLVVVSVWPEWLECDHWCVVRGVDLSRNKVYLVNHGPRGGVAWSTFKEEWWPKGEGLACKGT